MQLLGYALSGLASTARPADRNHERFPHLRRRSGGHGSAEIARTIASIRIGSRAANRATKTWTGICDMALSAVPTVPAQALIASVWDHGAIPGVFRSCGVWVTGQREWAVTLRQSANLRGNFRVLAGGISGDSAYPDLVATGMMFTSPSPILNPDRLLGEASREISLQ
jgi:hypothetical protein